MSLVGEIMFRTSRQVSQLLDQRDLGNVLSASIVGLVQCLTQHMLCFGSTVGFFHIEIPCLLHSVVELHELVWRSFS